MKIKFGVTFLFIFLFSQILLLYVSIMFVSNNIAKGLVMTFLSIDGIIIIMYFFSRFYFKPTISIIVSGQQSGSPIPLPSLQGTFQIGITTNLKKEVILEEIRVGFDDELVDIDLVKAPETQSWNVISSKNKSKIRIREMFLPNDTKPTSQEQVRKTFAFTKEFPLILSLTNRPKVSADYIKLYVFSYKSVDTSETFSILFDVFAKLDEYELGTPWDMFPPIINRHSEKINFKIEQSINLDSSQKLTRYGFPIAPKKTVIVGESLKKD